jgi:hypothetical protein
MTRVLLNLDLNESKNYYYNVTRITDNSFSVQIELQENISFKSSWKPLQIIPTEQKVHPDQLELKFYD